MWDLFYFFRKGATPVDREIRPTKEPSLHCRNLAAQYTARHFTIPQHARIDYSYSILYAININ